MWSLKLTIKNSKKKLCLIFNFEAETWSQDAKFNLRPVLFYGRKSKNDQKMNKTTLFVENLQFQAPNLNNLNISLNIPHLVWILKETSPIWVFEIHIWNCLFFSTPSPLQEFIPHVFVFLVTLPVVNFCLAYLSF